MQADVISGATPLRAQAAVLLYGRAHHAPEYCSVHAVSEDDAGALNIEAGTPATVQGLQDLFDGLNPEKSDRPQFIESNILSRGARWLVWWAKPSVRRVWFQADKIGEKSAEVPNPGLVFAVTPAGVSVFALKGKGRPRPGTRLYQAPYYNVWEGGKLCVGSARVPEGALRDDPAAWERMFFESKFTHPNVHTKGGLIAHRRGPVSFWKEMLAGKHASFPTDLLVDCGMTLEQMLARLNLGGVR